MNVNMEPCTDSDFANHCQYGLMTGLDIDNECKYGLMTGLDIANHCQYGLMTGLDLDNGSKNGALGSHLLFITIFGLYVHPQLFYPFFIPFSSFFIHYFFFWV